MPFFPKKSLGQNFLIDETVLNKIVDFSKIEVIQKDINYIKKIQNNKSFETSDMQVIDTLLQKYTG